MAVYTSINSSDLNDWIEKFNFKDLVNFKGISSGVTNSNYLIQMAHSNYILTIFEHNNIEELPFYIDLMTYLAKENFLCPRPIENKNGQALGLLKDKPALMVSFLDGKEKVIRSPKSCYLVGQYLAKLHLTANNFPQLNKNTRGLDWVSDMYLNLKKYLSLEDQGILELEINYHKEMDKAELPEGIIHGDLFKDNVLFLNDKVSGFIDFYYACNEKFIYDIAIAINDWCIDQDGQINKSMFLEFIKGYQSKRKLTDNEQEYLNVALRLAALRFWLSRLEDFYNAKEGEITSIKDPKHFKDILLDRQAMKNYAN
jgi:homoserine kinase type II